MKRMKRLLALLCAALVLTGAACGRAEPEPEPTETAAAETAAATETSTEVPAAAQATDTETSAAADETQTETQEASAENAEITLEAGLDSTDVEKVLAFYKLAAEKNDVKQYTKMLDLVSLDGGEGKVASHVDVFEPIAKKAVAKNSVTDDPLPGNYASIRPEDWTSASAQSDGRYTTIRVRVAEQTDGARGKAFEGPVGRTMTVLDGVDQAVNEMVGVSADFDSGKVEIAYRDPTFTVKVDNRTGKFVPGTCTWTYRVHATLYSLDAKVLAFNVHLQNASGVIDYTISY
jgi:hypothetical protein